MAIGNRSLSTIRCASMGYRCADIRCHIECGANDGAHNGHYHHCNCGFIYRVCCKCSDSARRNCIGSVDMCRWVIIWY
jgi:hypothetical protein